MNDVIIKVSNLTKQFKIYHNAQARLKELFFFGKRKFHRPFHALKNISFEIHRGEYIAIVGKNGAGKSTLLKILSQELTPTHGIVEIKGTVSLLQLGAGFDGELTGYENAKFACQIQGLKESELEAALQEIEKFADIGEFFNHPLKTYSTGMHSRLSFACAINVNPDILIVDEVLSVGDPRFAQKCLRKMHSFKENGKTVIFVTHNLDQIGVFCDKILWILGGEIYRFGPTHEVLEDYRSFMLFGKLPNEMKAVSQKSSAPEEGWIQIESLPHIGGEVLRLLRARLLDCNGNYLGKILSGSEISIELEMEALIDIQTPQYGIAIYDSNGIIALHSNNEIAEVPFPPLRKGTRAAVQHKLTLPLMNKGTFFLSLSTKAEGTLDHRVHDILAMDFETTLSPRFGYMQIPKEQALIQVIS